jgi:hypothetical protein
MLGSTFKLEVELDDSLIDATNVHFSGSNNGPQSIEIDLSMISFYRGSSKSSLVVVAQLVY